MAHIKILTPDSQDFSEPVAQLVKLANGKLRGSDLSEFIKRASTQFIDKMASIEFRAGEVPVHLIAMGAHSRYGSNRNGDAFTEAVCREYHPTFVKHARAYRDHQNKDKSKSYGIVKASAYNEEMHRVELIVAYNGTKEAADRNGGLVADEELEKLASDTPLGVSMACRVSRDICSGCGNEARTRAEYCGPELCKYGGCKDNLAKTFDDGTTLSVFNPDPTFFDISKVFRPADRIAYTLGIAKKASDYYELMKEAQEHYGAEYGSSALAEKLGVTPPLWAMADGPWTNPYVVAQLKTASDLACFEEALSSDRDYSPQDLAFSEVVQPVHTDLPDARSGLFKLSHIVSALAEERCLLPLANFLALLSGHDNVKTAAEQVAERLPGVYSRLSLNPSLENELQHNPYRPTVAPQSVRQWVQKHASEWSLSRPHIMQRMQLAMLRQPKTPTRRPFTKIATTVAADELAKHYALYQLGFLTAVSGDPDAQRFRELAVRSNFVRA